MQENFVNKKSPLPAILDLRNYLNESYQLKKEYK